jgi:hypothetical protein
MELFATLLQEPKTNRRQDGDLFGQEPAKRFLDIFIARVLNPPFGRDKKFLTVVQNFFYHNNLHKNSWRLLYEIIADK